MLAMANKSATLYLWVESGYLWVESGYLWAESGNKTKVTNLYSFYSHAPRVSITMSRHAADSKHVLCLT